MGSEVEFGVWVSEVSVEALTSRTTALVAAGHTPKAQTRSTTLRVLVAFRLSLFRQP